MHCTSPMWKVCASNFNELWSRHTGIIPYILKPIVHAKHPWLQWCTCNHIHYPSLPPLLQSKKFYKLLIMHTKKPCSVQWSSGSSLSHPLPFKLHVPNELPLIPSSLSAPEPLWAARPFLWHHRLRHFTFMFVWTMDFHHLFLYSWRCSVGIPLVDMH